MIDLTEAIRIAGRYDFEALRDLRDRLEYDLLADDALAAETRTDQKRLRTRRNRVALRRRGLAGRGMDAIRYPDALADVPDLPGDQQRALLAAVVGLIDAKRPTSPAKAKDGDPIARGSWQTKTQYRDQIRRAPDGLPETDEHGHILIEENVPFHYLYLRVYTTNQEGRKRVASIYIGSLNRQEAKPFLAAVQAGHITDEQIVAVFRQGGYEAVKEWRNEMDADA